MKTLLNIRGTNGSGKSTLARRFFGELDATVKLCSYLSKASTLKTITGTINPENHACVVGDYGTMAGGLDKIPTFALQFEAIEAALALDDVGTAVAEGVLASTVFGSWARHAGELNRRGIRVVWAFLQTPIETCLERIQIRNGGKPIKEDLVEGKLLQIDRVREKAEACPDIEAMILPYGDEWEAIVAADLSVGWK